MKKKCVLTSIQYAKKMHKTIIPSRGAPYEKNRHQGVRTVRAPAFLSTRQATPTSLRHLERSLPTAGRAWLVFAPGRMTSRLGKSVKDMTYEWNYELIVCGSSRVYQYSILLHHITIKTP